MTTSNTTLGNLESLPSFESMRSAKSHHGFMNRARYCSCGRQADVVEERGRHGRHKRLDACRQCLKNHGRPGPDTPPTAPVVAMPLPLPEAA